MVVIHSRVVLALMEIKHKHIKKNTNSETHVQQHLGVPFYMTILTPGSDGMANNLALSLFWGFL